MEDRIKESMELCDKKGVDPYDREPLSNSLPQYIHLGIENTEMMVTVNKRWIVLSGLIRAGLANENLKDHIQEVKEEYED